MGALPQAKWYAKQKTLVPSWVFQREEIIKAYFMALAKVLEESQLKVVEHADDTFITRATGTVLNTHGYERSIPRLPGEVDPSYSIRVQNLLNQSNVPALLAFINQVLVAGMARIQEDFNSGLFCDREIFCNRAGIFLSEPIHNTFSIVVDKQIHAPFSFADREYFADREDFIGTAESLDRVFDLILQIVNDNKALGTFFRIIELLE